MPEIPPRLLHRPTYKGMVIPFTTMLRDDGIPDFTVNHEVNRMLCLTHKLCAICGARLDYWMFVSGGESVKEFRHLIDPPMHEECARYAVAICPFLNGSHRVYSERETQHIPANTEVEKFPMRAGTQQYLLKTRGYVISPPALRTGWQVTAFCRPWASVEEV